MTRWVPINYVCLHLRLVYGMPVVDVDGSWRLFRVLRELHHPYVTAVNLPQSEVGVVAMKRVNQRRRLRRLAPLAELRWSFKPFFGGSGLRSVCVGGLDL